MGDTLQEQLRMTFTLLFTHFLRSFQSLVYVTILLWNTYTRHMVTGSKSLYVVIDILVVCIL